MARVKFPEGKQCSFFDAVGLYFKNDWTEVSRFLRINARTLKDWRRERYTMDYASLKNLLSLTKISMPQDIEILEDYWSAKKYSRIGALKRSQMYGALGTPEGRRIGIMLADGGLTNYQLNITLNSQTDKEYLGYVKNLLEKLFHIQSTIMLLKNKLAARIVVSGRNLVELVKRYGLKVGNKVRQSVDVPVWVLRKNELAVACLRGLMDTDSSCYAYAHSVNKKRYYNFALCFTNASGPLLKSVYAILDKNGYHPCVTSRRVYVHKKNDIAKYFQKVGTHNNKHLHKYQKFVDCRV